MSPNLNTRARINRAIRNNQKVYSAWETFRKFKWFTLVIVFILPIYPSLSVLGSGYETMTGNYDDSTIITAYSGDGEEGDVAYIGENGMISTDFDTSSKVPNEKGPIKPKANTADIYTVKSGDTLSRIASQYGVTTDTILWANDLSPDDDLKVGMNLKVPPVSGVVYSVGAGDTISEIASHYGVDADDIVRVNNLKDAGSIRKGMDLMIPGAAKKIEKQPQLAQAPAIIPVKSLKADIPQIVATTKPVAIKEPPVALKDGLKSRYAVKYTGKGGGFAWGNCTWFVAQNKSVSWRGNANRWISNAKAAGIKTGSTPIPGSIIQFSGRGYNRYYGHVGIVADVTDDYVIVKDMNYRSLNEVTIRKVPIDDDSIDGYIYVD